MDPRAVRRLEQELEDAITDAIMMRLGRKHLPRLPSRHTIEMMAKAAAAVYEATAEEDRPERD